MTLYALMDNPALAVTPKGVPRHVEDEGKLKAVGTHGKWICSECAKVGFLLKSPED
jgi:hypothetical protein